MKTFPLIGASLILISFLHLAGCGKSESAPKAPAESQSPAQVSRTEPPKKAPTRPIDLAAVTEAKKLISLSCSQISFMQDDAAFERSRTGQDNALGIIDVNSLKKAIELVAQLPDNHDNEFIKPVSEVVPRIREMLELYSQAITEGKPFSGGSETGPKMAKLAADFGLVLDVAISESLKRVPPQ